MLKVKNCQHHLSYAGYATYTLLYASFSVTLKYLQN